MQTGNGKKTGFSFRLSAVSFIVRAKSCFTFPDPALPIYERSSRRKFNHHLKQISIYIHGKCTALHLRQILCDR